MTKPHEVRVYVHEKDGKYEIRVTGVTSGARVNFGDGDSGSIVFDLDASRFYPVVKP
jgi:hypothetical protein